MGSFIDFDTDYGTPSLHKYFQTEEGKAGLPDHDAGIGCHVLLLQLFSKDIWAKIWSWLDADGDGEISSEELAALDTDGDGKLSKAELRSALCKVLGLDSHADNDTLLEMIMKVGGDKDGDMQLTTEEINAAQQ